MKVKPTSRSGQVVVQLNWRDERLLDAGARAAVAFHLERILVPLDFSICSRKALRYALLFARPFGARLRLVHVVEPMIVPENMLMAVPELPDAGVNWVQDARDRLAELAKREIPVQVKADTEVRVGRPYIEIIESAKSWPADLIIIATHGYTGLKHVFLGSTAERVVRHANCPVLTLREPEKEPA